MGGDTACDVAKKEASALKIAIKEIDGAAQQIRQITARLKEKISTLIGDCPTKEKETAKPEKPGNIGELESIIYDLRVDIGAFDEEVTRFEDSNVV